MSKDTNDIKEIRVAVVQMGHEKRRRSCEWLPSRFSVLGLNAVLVGAVGTAEEAITQLPHWRPDILFTGLLLGSPTDGIDLARYIHDHAWDVDMRVILWTIYNGPESHQPMLAGVFRWVDYLAETAVLDQVLQEAVASLAYL